eukprot:jgi/Botrbrau1/18795/Bobra.0820s0001.1
MALPAADGNDLCDLEQERSARLLGLQPFAEDDYLRDVANLQQVGILGRGSFGVVVKAVRLQDVPGHQRVVAVKLMPRGPRMEEMRTYVKREIVHQSALR